MIAIGTRFGRWTVEGEAPSKISAGGHARRQLRVRCDCGTRRIVDLSSLRAGTSTSCGCFNKEYQKAAHTKHGHSPHRGTSKEYSSWQNMLKRCTDRKHPAFKNYGGRGITVCVEWRHDFAAFLKHVGPCPGPGYSIDRKENDGHYEPGNVRWATRQEQARNQRRPRKLGA